MATAPAPRPAPRRTHGPRHHPRRADHAAVHRGERLSRAQGRADLRHLDPRRGDLDGDPALLQGRRRSSKTTSSRPIASAAGTLAAIIFVLPGLIMIGWWQGFPYWTTAAITAHRRHPRRDVLGAAAPRAGRSIPTCPIPKGVAAAEVLRGRLGHRARAREESAQGLRVLVVEQRRLGRLRDPHRRRSSSPAKRRPDFRVGAGATGISGSLSLALIGVGHLVGLSVGAAMFLGMVIGWWVLLPILTAHSRCRGERRRPGRQRSSAATCASSARA